MRLLFLAALFLSFSATPSAKAQTPSTTTATAPAPGGTSTAAAPAPAAPAAPPKKWKFSYFGEVQGPAVGNIDFEKTQTPGSPPEYSEWDHSLKLGYAISKAITVGTQFRAASPFDPKLSFSFADQRFYVQWNHFVETSDVDIMGKAVIELPTTDGSRQAGKLLAFNLQTNVELKTQLRNWAFSFATLIRPVFFNDPVTANKTDLVVGIYPYITMDMSPNVQLLFEASFEASHSYNSAFYDYNPGSSDYIDVGPIFTVNSHINTNVALRFFTDNISFKAAALYANIEVAL